MGEQEKASAQNQNIRQDPGQVRVAFEKLTPTSADLSPYREAFDFVFSQEEIRNVAITGSYGAGKSSLLESVKQFYGAKLQPTPTKGRLQNAMPETPQQSEDNNGHRFLTISLTHFDTNMSQNHNRADEDSTQSDQKDPSATLEGRIINQIIHRIDPDALPKTRFRKTSRPSIIRLLTVSAYIVFSVLYFMSLGNALLPDPFFHSVDTRSVFTVIWFIASTVMLLLAFQRDLFRKLIKRVGLGGNEVEFLGAESDSRFDKYMDDIVYLLHECKCDVIVFEDIDRFDDAEVFVRLREINELANALLDHERQKPLRRMRQHLKLCLGCDCARDTDPLRFFYLVRDDLFTSKDRTKFFDFLIPVIPYVDYSNSYSLLCESFPEGTPRPSSQCLKDVALFVEDARLLHNIVNEYAIYADKLNLASGRTTKESYSQLFSLVAYKNLFPIDFCKLQFDEGYLHSLIEKRRELQNEVEIQLHETLESLRKVAATRRFEIKDEEILRATKEYNILRKAAEQKGVLSDLDNAETIAELESWSIKLGLHDELIQKLKQLEMSGELEATVESRWLTDSSVSHSAIARHVEHMKVAARGELKGLLSLCQSGDVNYDLNAFFQPAGGKLTKDLVSNEERGISLVRTLLAAGYIDSSFRNYISLFREGGLTSQDHEYLMIVSAGEEAESDRVVIDPVTLIEEMDDSLFSRRGSRVFSLIGYLFKDEQRERANSKKQRVFLESLGGEKDARFIAQFISSGEYQSGIFTTGIGEDILPELVFSHKDAIEDKSLLRVFAVRFYLACGALPSPGTARQWEIVNNFISTDPEFMALDHEWFGPEDADALMSAMLTINIIGANSPVFSVIDFEQANTRVLSFVYENGLYEPSPTILRGMLETQLAVSGGSTIVELLQAIYEKRDSPLGAKAREEIDTVITYLLKDEGWMVVAGNETEWVLGSPNLSIKLAHSFIQRIERNSAQQLSSYPKILWIPLLSQEAVVPTLDNSLRVFAEVKEIGSGLGDFISSAINGITESGEQDCSAEKVDIESILDIGQQSAFFNALVDTQFVNKDAFAKLLQFFDYHYDEIDPESADPEKLELIALQGWLKFSPEAYKSIYDYNHALGAAFALESIEIYCQLAGEGHIALNLDVVNSILSDSRANYDQCSFLIETMPDSLQLSLDYSDTANSILLEETLTNDEVSLLPDLWNVSSNQFRAQIVRKYQELANESRSLGPNVPFAPLLNILKNKEIGLEYRKLLFAANISHLTFDEVCDGLNALGLFHFRNVVKGEVTKKKTKTPFPQANIQIAIQLCKNGLCSSWWADGNNKQHIWLQNKRKHGG